MKTNFFNRLTPKQAEVLAYIDRRVPIKVIADEMGVSESRVNQHIRALKNHYGTENLNGLVECFRAECADGTVSEGLAVPAEQPPIGIITASVGQTPSQPPSQPPFHSPPRAAFHLQLNTPHGDQSQDMDHSPHQKQNQRRGIFFRDDGDESDSSAEQFSGEGLFRKTGYRNPQLAAEGFNGSNQWRGGSGDVALARTDRVLADSPRSDVMEPVVVPQMLDGNHAVFFRLLAILGIALGTVAAIILVVSAAMSLTAIGGRIVISGDNAILIDQASGIALHN